MKRSDLVFNYPLDLIATAPIRPSRVMVVENNLPQEVSFQNFLDQIPNGDLLLLNKTKVVKRRVFAGQVEILFLDSNDQRTWTVLFPSRKMKINDCMMLPGSIEMRLLEKGRPQKVQTSEFLDGDYFQKYGEPPLPPYIQKARDSRHSSPEDLDWYQTAWAEQEGSFAAPTASLHFTNKDISYLQTRGVHVASLTLHVGLGTFLPVEVEDLKDHKMHFETVEIPEATQKLIEETKKQGRHVWALGTTVARSLESQALGYFKQNELRNWVGQTDLLIQPGYNWKIVDRLLTNFHQPESTLLALVAAFSDIEKVKSCYQWAIERKYRLFSYGDLSVWIR